MSATQSNLSASQYGYDIVVATTQDSINETMKEYLSTGDQPEIRMYWNYDPKIKKNVIVDEATLLSQLGGTSPFDLDAWDGTGDMPDELSVIDSSNFQFAFRAQIGLPNGYTPDSIPDLIQLDPKSNQVTFNLLCSEFQVVQADVYRSLDAYYNVSQEDGNAWIITTKVPLKTITDNTDLPAAVQAQLNNLGATAFSVQQLLLDLDNAFLESTPTISGIDPASDVYPALQSYFLNAYFNALKDNKLPALGYTLINNDGNPDPSTLKISDLKMEANPFFDANGTEDDKSGLITLNYLCAANGGKVVNNNTFTWNWLDTAADNGDFDGVTAINRNTLGKYFNDKLHTYVLSNCWLPSVKVTTDGLYVTYEYGMTAGQQPTMTVPPTGSTVLSYSYDSGTVSDQAGLNGDMGKMRLQSTFNMTVDFVGTTIVVKQHLLVYVYIENSSTGKGGNIIDRTITDTYSIGVGASGQLQAVLGTPVDTDNSQRPGVNGFLNFFTDINGLAAQTQEWYQGMAALSFEDVPVSVMQGFVFPGGKTFIFKDAMFSDNQDLISHITYIDPS